MKENHNGVEVAEEVSSGGNGARQSEIRGVREDLVLKDNDK